MRYLSNYQIILMGMNVFSTTVIMSLPAQIIRIAGQDAWMCYFPALLLMLVPVWLYSMILRRFPEQDLFLALNSRFPFLGGILSIFYILFFFFILIRDLRMLIDLINNTLLPLTPSPVIAALVIFTCILAARGGVQVVARMHELFYPILVVIVASLPLLLYSEVDLRFLKPVLNHGVLPVFHGSWYALSYLGEITVLPFISSNRAFQFRQGLKGLVFSTIMLEVLIILNILVLGPNIAGRIMYPNYELVREIRISEFLDRFDSILVMLYIPTFFLKLSLMLHIICYGMKQAMPDFQEKTLTTLIGILAFVCTFWFCENSVQLLNLNGGWTSIALFFEFLVPVILFGVLKPKRI
jgi:spore germination protein